jgi:hypothetical protein
MMVPYNGQAMDTGVTMAPGGDDAIQAGVNGGITPTHILMAAMDLRASGRLSQIYAAAQNGAGTKRK